MNKAQISALEKVFAAEIEGRLPFQSKAQIFRALCHDGYLSEMQRNFGSGFGRVTVSGYELTHAGRFEYCLTCRDEEP